MAKRLVNWLSYCEWPRFPLVLVKMVVRMRARIQRHGETVKL